MKQIATVHLGSANYIHWLIVGPKVILENQVLLEHSHAYSFIAYTCSYAIQAE